MLLNTWKKLDKKFVLILVGGGILEKYLRKEYDYPNIKFKGKQSRKDTRRLIATSKYLIQLSLWYETFGLTIIEAMSCGVPVIGFDIGTRTEFIQDSKNGFICNKGSLQKTIEKSYEYNDYKTLSNNAYLTAKKFDIAHITAMQLSIYADIVEKG